jgi:putative glycosyltransferase (TIGR04372 family)
MIRSKFIKVVSKNLLSSDQRFYSIFRSVASGSFIFLGNAVRPFSAKVANFLHIYGRIFAFDPDRLAAEMRPDWIGLDSHLVIASRAFFQIAFAQGKLPSIYNFLEKTTAHHPQLFVPWKLLHYSYYFTKSWESLSKVSNKYELYRRVMLESAGVLDFDLIIGDQVTSSIGHSQIFFDFHILKSHYLVNLPKIAIHHSVRDKMSAFYKEIIPYMFLNILNVGANPSRRADSVNFIQDSFPLLFAKKYFDYSDERGRTKYLASWAATGAKAFTISFAQKSELSTFLQRIGLTSDDWYVVLHVRETPDGSIRNADIESYYDAIKVILANGGWVFRIGDTAMTPLRNINPKVIDLPFCKHSKPNFIDLYLLASARFVICTCSGPSDFPFYFNVPRLVTNWPCMSALHGTSNDICVPVSYRRSTDNQIIPLIEQLTSMSYDNEPQLRALADVMAIKNSARQIKKATIEMIELTTPNHISPNFPHPLNNSLFYKYKDKIWFMGSIAKSFLADNPNYLD